MAVLVVRALVIAAIDDNVFEKVLDYGIQIYLIMKYIVTKYLITRSLNTTI